MFNVVYSAHFSDHPITDSCVRVAVFRRLPVAVFSPQKSRSRRRRKRDEKILTARRSADSRYPGRVASAM